RPRRRGRLPRRRRPRRASTPAPPGRRMRSWRTTTAWPASSGSWREERTVASLRDRLGKSFLELNHRVIGLIGIALLVVGSAFALLLSGGVFAHTYHVTA